MFATMCEIVWRQRIISIFNQLSNTICGLGMNVIHINTSERNRGMDIHQLKQRIDASGNNQNNPAIN